MCRIERVGFVLLRRLDLSAWQTLQNALDLFKLLGRDVYVLGLSSGKRTDLDNKMRLVLRRERANCNQFLVYVVNCVHD